MDNEYYKEPIGCGIICMLALLAFVALAIAVLVNAFYQIGK